MYHRPWAGFFGGGGGVTKVKAEAGVLYGKCPSNGGPRHRL